MLYQLRNAPDQEVYIEFGWDDAPCTVVVVNDDVETPEDAQAYIDAAVSRFSDASKAADFLDEIATVLWNYARHSADDGRSSGVVPQLPPYPAGIDPAERAFEKARYATRQEEAARLLPTRGT